MCKYWIITDMKKIKYTLLALISSSAIIHAATTITGTGSLSNSSVLISVATRTFEGLTVTDGSTTITYDLTVTGDFRITDSSLPYVLTIMASASASDRNASFSVSNVTDNHSDPTVSFDFDGFTSIHAYHNLDSGTGEYTLAHAGGTFTGIIPPLGSGGGNGTKDKTGKTETFAASSTLSVALTSTDTSSNFVRFDEVGVSFTSSSAVHEPSSAALLGVGGISLVLRRKE